MLEQVSEPFQFPYFSQDSRTERVRGSKSFVSYLWDSYLELVFMYRRKLVYWSKLFLDNPA